MAPEFAAPTHVSRHKLSPVKGLNLRLGLDLGLTPACVIAQKLPKNRWQVYREICTTDMALEEFAEELKRIMQLEFAGFRMIAHMDPAGRSRDYSGRNAQQVFAKAGLRVDFAPGNNDPLMRYGAVAAPLSRLTQGVPALLIDPSCETLITGLAGKYCFKRVQISGDERYQDKPDKNFHSHICEALQYLMVAGGEAPNVDLAALKKMPKSYVVNDWSPMDSSTWGQGAGRQPQRYKSDFDPYSV